MTIRLGLLTAGSDCPGLNAVIRAIGKAAMGAYGMQVTAFQDGFLGLVHDQTMPIESSVFSGILTLGGTILGTSRDKPHEMLVDGKTVDLTAQAVETYRRHNLDALVCIGGRETQESALHLAQAGLNLITVPKAIDNDVAGTDLTVGFDTALEIAGESIDRLHSTAHSHHRIILVEMMGRYTGWLTLGAGIAGGADVILIPEIPYDIHKVAEAVQGRARAGKMFSLVALAETTVSREELAFTQRLRDMNARLRTDTERERVAAELDKVVIERPDTTFHVSNLLKELTGLETRVTILGYLLRGGAPSATDRILATQLGTAAVEFIRQGNFGIMVATQGGQVAAVPLADVTGHHKYLPMDHPWVTGARNVGTALGD